MENWFDYLKNKYSTPWIIVPATISITFCVLAGVVTMFSDMGFSEQVTNNRIMIIILLLGISVLSYVLYKTNLLVNKYRNTVKDNISLRNTVQELEGDKKSLLGLMESYKNQAYNNILDHLRTMLNYSKNKNQWLKKEARVSKIRVKPLSGIADMDLTFAKRESLDIVINLGSEDEIMIGMEFAVEDPSIYERYGMIIVNEVFQKASICNVTNIDNNSFWSTALNTNVEKDNVMLPVIDNRIIPNIPSSFDNVPEDVIDELLIIIAKIQTSSEA
jgi:hypothetical protein